jgi:hypothetical protein
MTPREVPCQARTLRVGGTMNIGVGELFVLLIAFASPVAVGAWVLRR